MSSNISYCTCKCNFCSSCVHSDVFHMTNKFRFSRYGLDKYVNTSNSKFIICYLPILHIRKNTEYSPCRNNKKYFIANSIFEVL